jgi:hypothetical protein
MNYFYVFLSIETFFKNNLTHSNIDCHTYRPPCQSLIPIPILYCPYLHSLNFSVIELAMSSLASKPTKVARLQQGKVVLATRSA